MKPLTPRKKLTKIFGCKRADRVANARTRQRENRRRAEFLAKHTNAVVDAHGQVWLAGPDPLPLVL